MHLSIAPAIFLQKEPMMSPNLHLHELTPTEVHHALHDRTIVLIDVREPQEYVTERIHGALLFPLSTFDSRHCRPMVGRWCCIAVPASGPPWRWRSASRPAYRSPNT
jgi:hypothetical protein